jgi:hypothetical protein
MRPSPAKKPAYWLHGLLDAVVYAAVVASTIGILDMICRLHFVHGAGTLLYVAEAVLAILVSAAVFGSLRPRHRWVWKLFSISPSQLNFAWAAAVFVIGGSVGLTALFGYVEECTRCGSLTSYATSAGGNFIGAMAEQLFHCGLLITLLLLSRGRIWFSVLMAGLLFVQLHDHSLRSQPETYGRIFVAGVLLALTTIYFKSVWPAACMHGLFDALAVIVMQGDAGSNPLFAISPTLLPLDIQTGLMGLLVLGLSILVLRRYRTWSPLAVAEDLSAGHSQPS